MIFSTYFIAFNVFPTVIVYKTNPNFFNRYIKGVESENAYYYRANMNSCLNLGAFFISMTLGFLTIRRYKPATVSNIGCFILLFLEAFFSTFIAASFYDKNNHHLVAYFAWCFILVLGFLHGMVSTHFETKRIPLS